MGMKELSFEPVLLLAAIGGVTDQWMADGGEVSANLMGAPRLQARLEIGLGRKLLQHGEMRARLTGRGARDGHPVTLARGAPDRRIDRPRAGGEPTFRQSQVHAFDLPLADLFLKRCMSRVGTSDNQQAAGSPVEAVNDARAFGVRAARKHLPQRLHKSRPLMRRGWMNDEPGRLVDHREHLVEVNYAWLGNQSAAWRRRATASSAAPAVIATSARLKGGQKSTSM